jgi:hypothetical protein
LRYPVLERDMPEGRSLICLPLDSTPPSVGVIGLTFDDGWVPGPVEMDFLTAYADTCGQAVRRIQASDDARDRAARLTYLARVSAELARSLDYRATLTNVANLTVPTLADWASVAIVQDGVPTTLAVAHIDPEKVRWARELQSQYPPDPNAATGVPNVIRTGLSEFYPEINDEMLVASARDEEQLRLLRELELRSALTVPISARGRTLGALSLIRSGDGLPYTNVDLALAEDVGRRAGIAIDNAHLYGQTQDIALQLQRAVLPEALDDVAGWEIAAHYSAGGRGGVGGDFYDAVPLPDGNLAFVIGDVMGHGVHAAAAMAQLRSAVRAYLCIDPEPTAVVGRLDVMYERLHIGQLATLVYGVVDVSAQEITFVNAGHYPPLVLTTAGPPSFAETTPQRPLGAQADERTATTVGFGPSDTLVLYTDGLIETRGEVIDVGLERLRAAASLLVGRRLDDGLAELVARLGAGVEAEDDITAFALRAQEA